MEVAELSLHEGYIYIKKVTLWKRSRNGVLVLILVMLFFDTFLAMVTLCVQSE